MLWERFTERARKVMQLAAQEAQRFNHDAIGTEHILLGIIVEGNGVAANVLLNLGLDLKKVRLEVEKIVPTGSVPTVAGKLPHTPRAKKVLDFAVKEAEALGHNYVGTEHLLLGLFREGEGVAPHVLMNLGLKLDEVRSAVLEFLGQADATLVDPALGKTKAEGPVEHLIDRAVKRLKRYQSLTSEGKFAAAGSELDELARILKKLADRLPGK